MKNKYSQEHYRDFADFCELPIYVRKIWNMNDDIGEFWDEEEAREKGSHQQDS